MYGPPLLKISFKKNPKPNLCVNWPKLKTKQNKTKNYAGLWDKCDVHTATLTWLMAVIMSYTTFRLAFLSLGVSPAAGSDLPFSNPCNTYIFHLVSSWHGLPISSSFVWSGGFLPCSFICCIFLCLLILLNLLCLGSPFCRLHVRSSHCFWCLPPVSEGFSMGCVGFLVEGTDACVLVDEAGSCLSGGQDRIWWCVLGCLWTCYDFRQPLCQWVSLCSCLASCLARGVQHWSLLVVEWSWVLSLRWRSLGELCRLILRGAGRSLVDQCPELGSPTSEAQAWHLAGAPRPCQPHSSHWTDSWSLPVWSVQKGYWRRLGWQDAGAASSAQVFLQQGCCQPPCLSTLCFSKYEITQLRGKKAVLQF